MADIDDWLNLLANSLPRDEQGRPAFAWYEQAQNPAHAVGNLAGIAGTLLKNPIQAGVLEPALGAALLGLRESGLQPRQSLLAPVDPGAPTALDQDALRRYLLASTPEGPAAFARGMVTDPTSYLGTGVFGMAGRGVARAGAGAGIRPLEAAGRGIAGIDEQYLRGVNAVMGGLGQGVRWGASRTPGLKAFTEAAPVKELAQFAGGIGRAIQTLPERLGGVEQVFGGLEGLGLRQGTRVWADLAEGWRAVDAGISQLEHPLQQVAVLEQRRTAVELKNLIESRSAQAREGVEDSFRDGIISAGERRADLDHIWTLQARGVHGVQEGLLDAIGEAKTIPLTGRLAPEAEVAIQGQIDDVLKEITDWQLQARDMATALTGGEAGGEAVTGMLNMADQAQGVVGRAGEDTFYRQARQNLIGRLGSVIPDIQAQYADVVAPEDMAAVTQAAQGAFDARFGDLRQYAQELPDMLAGMDPAKRAILDTNEQEISRALGRVLAARRRVTNAVAPLLDDYYREIGASVEQRAASVANALKNSKNLLAEPALADPSAWGVRTRVEEIIAKYQPYGDILQPKHSGALTTNLIAQARSKELGIKELPPWFGWAATALSQWRELALLSPRYHISNLLSILTLSANQGVPPTEILSQLGENLVDVTRHGWFNPAQWQPPVQVGGRYAAVRGGELPPQLLGYQGISQGEMFVDRGRGLGARTAIGRLPIVARAGIPGLATGGAYWAANEDNPNRVAGTLAAAAGGAAFGAALPRFVLANKNLAAATEHAARATAFHTTVEEVMPAVVKDFTPQIKEILGKPVAFQSLGKPVMRGQTPVRTLADLLGGPAHEPWVPPPPRGAPPPPPFAPPPAGAPPSPLGPAPGGAPAPFAPEMTAPPPPLEGPPLPPAPPPVEAPPTAPPGAVPAAGVVDLPVDAVRADPDRFQYKVSGIGGRGVSAELREVPFNPDLAGTIAVWRDPANGETFVVNGHHRLDLARRRGVATIRAEYIDAPTEGAARVAGALRNVAEGRGTAIDAAKLFRETGLTPDELLAQGISLTGAVARDGLALARLDGELWSQVFRGEMKQSRAVAIGQALPDPADQRALVAAITKREKRGAPLSDEVVLELARQAQAAPRTTATVATLFGDEMFTENLLMEKSQLAVWVKKQLSTDRRLFGTVARGGAAERLSEAGNVIQVTESARLAQQAAQAEEVFDRLRFSAGTPVSDALNEAAAAIARKENANAIRTRLYEAVRDSVSTALRGGEAGGAVRPGGLPEPPLPAAAGLALPEPSPQPGLFDLPAQPAAAAIEPAKPVSIEVTPAVPAAPALEPLPPDFQMSTGHVGVFGDWEYFFSPNGDLMRARISDPIDIYGYRSGARFESTPVVADRIIAQVRETFGERLPAGTAPPAPAAPATAAPVTEPAPVAEVPAPEAAAAAAVPADIDALRERGRVVTERITEHRENYPNLRDFDNRGVDDPRYKEAVTAHAARLRELEAERRAISIEQRAAIDAQRAAGPAPAAAPEAAAPAVPPPVPSAAAAVAEEVVPPPAIAATAPPEPPPPPPPPIAPAEMLTPPPPERAPGIVSVRMSRPSPTVTAGEAADWQAVERTFNAVDGNLTPDQLYDLALRHHATPEQADALRASWDQAIGGAEQAGVAQSNAINFDYTDVSKGIDFLRTSGIAPFITWTSKAGPLYASILAQNPRYIVAIDQLNSLSEEDIEEAGLSQKYARMGRLGILGDFLADTVLGRPDATLVGSPLQALFPFSDVGRPAKVREDANLVERGLDAIQSLGLGVSPLVTLPLQAVGAIDATPTNLLRTSSYLEAATSPLGNAADPEALVKQGLRGVREVFGQEEPVTVTGNEIKDYAIRQRIAEMALEATGKPAAGDYRRAMDDPASPIWQLARAQVERQYAGQTALSAVLPFRTRALSEQEERVMGARAGQGIAPSDLEGTTKEERAAMWKQATAADPLAGGFSALGNDEKQVLARQFPEMQTLWKRTNRMRPAQKAKIRGEFLETRPILRRYLAERAAVF